MCVQVIPADHDLQKMLHQYEENREKILAASYLWYPDIQLHTHTELKIKIISFRKNMTIHLISLQRTTLYPIIF